MPKDIEKVLAQARNPQTEPGRLRQLSQWKRRNERFLLRQAIATNPNSEESLLLELAAEHPGEVIENPQFQLLQISNELWWEDCEPISLLMLLAELGSNAPRQMRCGFLNFLAEQLTSTDLLWMNKEWHMSFSAEVWIEWQSEVAKNASKNGMGEESVVDCGEDGYLIGDPRDNDEDSGGRQEQRFSIKFHCVAEKNSFSLKPPSSLDSPVGCIEALIGANTSEDLLAVLGEHGWEEELDYTPGGQGYWEIECVTPELDSWEFEAHLIGDGSGSVQITDPSGETHEVEIDAPADYGDKYLNPTFEEHPIAAILGADNQSLPRLYDRLSRVIANQKQCNAGDTIQFKLLLNP